MLSNMDLENSSGVTRTTHGIAAFDFDLTISSSHLYGHLSELQGAIHKDKREKYLKNIPPRGGKGALQHAIEELIAHGIKICIMTYNTFNEDVRFYLREVVGLGTIVDNPDHFQIYSMSSMEGSKTQLFDKAFQDMGITQEQRTNWKIAFMDDDWKNCADVERGLDVRSFYAPISSLLPIDDMLSYFGIHKAGHDHKHVIEQAYPSSQYSYYLLAKNQYIVFDRNLAKSAGLFRLLNGPEMASGKILLPVRLFIEHWERQVKNLNIRQQQDKRQNSHNVSSHPPLSTTEITQKKTLTVSSIINSHNAEDIIIHSLSSEESIKIFMRELELDISSNPGRYVHIPGFALSPSPLLNEPLNLDAMQHLKLQVETGGLHLEYLRFIEKFNGATAAQKFYFLSLLLQFSESKKINGNIRQICLAFANAFSTGLWAKMTDISIDEEMDSSSEKSKLKLFLRRMSRLYSELARRQSRDLEQKKDKKPKLEEKFLLIQINLGDQLSKQSFAAASNALNALWEVFINKSVPEHGTYDSIPQPLALNQVEYLDEAKSTVRVMLFLDRSITNDLPYGFLTLKRVLAALDRLCPGAIVQYLKAKNVEPTTKQIAGVSYFGYSLSDERFYKLPEKQSTTLDQSTNENFSEIRDILNQAYLSKHNANESVEFKELSDTTWPFLEFAKEVAGFYKAAEKEQTLLRFELEAKDHSHDYAEYDQQMRETEEKQRIQDQQMIESVINNDINEHKKNIIS